MLLRKQLRNAITFVLQRVSRFDIFAISVSDDHEMAKHERCTLILFPSTHSLSRCENMLSICVFASTCRLYSFSSNMPHLLFYVSS
jgi:hypothetical protein